MPSSPSSPASHASFLKRQSSNGKSLGLKFDASGAADSPKAEEKMGQKSTFAFATFAGRIRSDLVRFAEFDADGSAELTFPEFHAMLPAKIHEKFSTEEVKKLFDRADLDGSGQLSINEWFLWSLENASMVHGKLALEKAFEKYDVDKTGSLDSLEFRKACEELGFGRVSDEIFQTLDADGSGHLSYREVLDALTTGIPADVNVKGMLTTLVLETQSDPAEDEARGRVQRIDTRGWSIKPGTVSEVRASLQKLLADSGALVGDLMRLFDTDGNPADITIDDGEFAQAMVKHCGCVRLRRN